MGLGIGDSLPGLIQQTDQSRVQNRIGARPPLQEEEQRQPALQAGFGANTASPVSVALDAIDRTVDQAQDFVPSVQDLTEEFRDRAEFGTAIQEAERGANEEPASLLPPPELVRPEPSAQVRNFEEQGALPEVRNLGEASQPDTQGINPVAANAANRLDIFA